MPLDPRNHADWEVAAEAETRMKSVYELAAGMNLENDELLPYNGKYIARVDFKRVLSRLSEKPDGKYIDVTAITPTPLGEGKSTSTIGLVQGLAKRGMRTSAAIRQPSGGPTMNIKGSAAGGGLAQCIPLTPFSLGLTGDINNIMNAHNLAMVALTSRMQHEFNYSDEQWAKRGMPRLDIDPRRVEIGWVIDFCAQALRDIVTGMGGKQNGLMMESRFQIAVSSEVMAILAVARDLADLRERMGRIVVARNRRGEPVTTRDLEVDGAMTAWMLDSINPTLMQTLEGQPVFVHAGPFANIAVGQSSIIADRLGLKLSDYHVTESGFGADIGFEKFCNIKCRNSGLKPNAAVIVATVRALKCHGGAPIPKPGRPMPEEYKGENIEWVERGCANLVHHISTVKEFGINPVVCINVFHTDTPNEIARIRQIAEAAGARVAESRHWEFGGEGALELADAVIDACNEPNDFRLLYDGEAALHERIGLIASKVYGADGVEYSAEARKKIEEIEKDDQLRHCPVCMVKTHLSLSDDPNLKGVPKGWRLNVRDVLTYRGAGFIVPVAGEISLMPGTASDPAYRRIDVDTESGRVTGLF